MVVDNLCLFFELIFLSILSTLKFNSLYFCFITALFIIKLMLCMLQTYFHNVTSSIQYFPE